MDDGKSNVAHDDTGCILLDNAGAYCPDVPSLLIRRRYSAECRVTFDVEAPMDSKGRPEAVSLWVSSPPRQYSNLILRVEQLQSDLVLQSLIIDLF